MPDIDITQIWVKRDARQRRKLEDDPSLQSSIRRVGLINAIIVKKDTLQLIAGERRWMACKAIGMTTIPVRWAEDLSADEMKVIELEENIKRKDLTWQDTTRAIADLHYLYGKANADWNQRKTADALSIDPGYISSILLVAAHLKDPRVAKASTHIEARNLIRRRNERANESEINDLAIFARGMLEAKPEQSSGSASKDSDNILGLPTPTPRPPDSIGPREAVERAIQQVDFLQWAPKYSGTSFNFIHCDFPYGVNVFDGAGQFKPEDQEGAYSDSAAEYWTLLQCLIDNLDRLLSPVSHLMIWLSPKPQILSMTLKFLSSTNLEFYPFPLIWHKSDNSGIVGDSQRWLRHTYESALLAYRGKRPLVKTVSDSYSGPGDRHLHPSAKPEPMLRHFFAALVDENTRFLDPTCGAASSLRAAESLGCLQENVLGLEIEERFISVGRESLLSSRILDSASRRAGGRV